MDPIPIFSVCMGTIPNIPKSATMSNRLRCFRIEHESCATDINELKWHCAYQGRLEARLRRKVDQAGQSSRLKWRISSSIL